MNYYIGADLGTSALKLLLVDTDGNIVNSVSKTYDVSFPNPAWSEQNPEDWWTALVDGVKDLTENIDVSLVRGIGVGGQMHGLVILDENDNVIRPAILWNDGRTFKETEYLNEVIGKEKLAELTGNIAFAGFTAPKIMWVRDNEPENFSKISKIMLPKDYLNYRLTGVHSIDYSDASGMLLLDVKNKKWSKEMLGICGINECQLPKLFESYHKTGNVLPEILKELGLTGDITVVAGAGDNAAAAIGTGTVVDGKCNISLGTSGTFFVSSKDYAALSNNAIHSFCHANGDYHIMGCILSAASCNKWLCEDILKTDDFAAEQSDITDENLGKNDVYFLPYLMGERSPINDTDARGVLIGMRLDTKRSDIVQAVLEGVAFAVRDNFEIAKEAGVNISRSTLCGGGAKSPLWRKIMANVLNIPIDIPSAEEGPGFGGAVLAMVGDGVYDDVTKCTNKFVSIKGTVEPTPEIVERYNDRYEKFKQIYPSLKDVFKSIK
ncbi:MAG: xylulokinase [Ruminococcaceae bacterium]|nr:xylulokinase [Oscillospiraceae bacterium]